MVVLSSPADREVTVMFDTQDGSAGGKWLSIMTCLSETITISPNEYNLATYVQSL